MRQELLSDRIRAIWGINVTTVSDPDLSQLVIAALNEYLRYRPGLELTTASTGITTVQDQQDYDLPDDALWIIGVGWDPSGLSDGGAGDNTVNQFYEQLTLSAFNTQHPSELTAMYQRIAAYSRYFGGSWKVVNGKIKLIPAPGNSGDKVAVYFAKARDIDDLNAITDQPFVQLCAAYLLQRRASGQEGEGQWRAGSYSRGGTSSSEAVKHAEREMLRARRICANSFQALRSGPSLSIRSEA